MTPSAPSSSTAAADVLLRTGAATPARLLVRWQAVAIGLTLLALALMAADHGADVRLADVFLMHQDLPVLAAEGVILLLITRGMRAPRPALFAWMSERRSAAPVCGAAALAVFTVGMAGWRLVFHGYPLSYDEFMATFDATSFRRGWLVAPMPAAWRAFAPALQPYSGLDAPGHLVWGSDYLPLNAALQGLAAALHGPALAGAGLSAASVVLTASIARKAWPGRPEAAIVAALLLASSSQLLVAGMTLYAMPAHLALNLLWLRLYQEDRRWSDGAALAVGWAACGLHQVVFHPLFVAPFVAQAALDRRFGRAALFTAGYAAVGLFWVMYFPEVFHLLGLPAASGKAGGPHAFALHVLQLLGSPDLALAPRLMAENLLRLMSWQNPLAVALALGGGGALLRKGGLSRSLLAGMALTVMLAGATMASQGHGWGYRYLHGFLGGFALVATDAYVRLTGPDWPPTVARRTILLSVAASVLVLAPWRASQAAAFSAPYARAHALIAGDRAPFVVLDGSGLSYADDLVRNAPDLGGRPLVFDLTTLSPSGADLLCRRGAVHVFDARDARTVGLPQAGPADWDGLRARLRARMAARGCALAHVAKP